MLCSEKSLTFSDLLLGRYCPPYNDIIIIIKHKPLAGRRCELLPVKINCYTIFPDIDEFTRLGVAVGTDFSKEFPTRNKLFRY